MNGLTEARFREILLELVDENPFAIRAVLRIPQRSLSLMFPHSLNRKTLCTG